MVIKTRILLFISTFLVLSYFANAQSSLIPLNYKILFEEARDNSFLELTQSEDQVTLKFNGSIKFNSNINSSMRVNFVQSQNRKYSVLILYTFLTKDSKSNFTVNVFDSEFRLVYKKDFEFFYEEPLPIIKITDEGKLIFFTPSEGMIQLIDKDSQTKKFLEEFNFNQERLGTIEIFDDTIFISLSGITDRKYSVTYILDSNLEIISQQNHPFQFVTQYIPFERNKQFISAYNFDDELKPNFSIVNENKIYFLGNILPIKIILDSKIIIADMKNIYEVDGKNLIRKYDLNNESVIKDIISQSNKIYLLVEKKDNYECLELNDKFELTKQISIGKLLGSSKLFYSSKIKKLLLINQNKFYLIN